MDCLIEDLSGDVPELAVGALDGPVNALFTLVDGQQELVLEGWYRSSYVYMGDGRSSTTAPTARPRPARASSPALRTPPI